MKKVLHLLSAGGAGGIELLCEQIGLRGTACHEFCFLFGMGEIAERMKDEGLKTYDFSGFSAPIKIKELVALTRKNKYDAVVVHHEGVGTYFLYRCLIKLCKGPKYIKYLHCSFEDKFFYTGNNRKDKMHYRLLSKILKESDALIAVSEFTRQSYVQEFGISADKIKVVYNGIDISESKEEPGEAGGSEGSTGLLYIGRLVDVKGVDVLIDALGILSKDHSLHLDILGDGPARTSLEQKVRDLGLMDTVTFHGVRLDKEAFFKRAQIFVYPPVWQEAFGISIIEAMAQGLICVASDIGGIPEIITEDKQGILFEAGNPKSLAEAIDKAATIAKSGVMPEYTEAAKKRAAFFTIEKSVHGLESLL
ncbi:glycosyltransferase family 4 protein [Butyrivibrio sp. MC2021]|uniref:glycosyltransferase family 4 protein n=1 Tax=Butyrivibrio sp. MC2021 TaxID=1408306 RepID=UPI0004794682|nr:glycosyltransferase family 4 protein [Butyrivibrio sp. MC2021]